MIKYNQKETCLYLTYSVPAEYTGGYSTNIIIEGTPQKRGAFNLEFHLDVDGYGMYDSSVPILNTGSIKRVLQEFLALTSILCQSVASYGTITKDIEAIVGHEIEIAEPDESVGMTLIPDKSFFNFVFDVKPHSRTADRNIQIHIKAFADSTATNAGKLYFMQPFIESETLERTEMTDEFLGLPATDMTVSYLKDAAECFASSCLLKSLAIILPITD